MRTAALVVSLTVAVGVPAAAQQAPRLTGTIDLTLGGPDETRDPFMFAFIGGLAMDAAGRIIVVEAKQGQMRVFSPIGSHLYSFGQPGAGPGDLGNPCCAAIDPKGRLWIQEQGNRRYSVFDLGASRPTFKWSTRAPTGTSRQDRINWDSVGHVSHTSMEYARNAPPRFVRYFVDSSGAVTFSDTLNEPPADAVQNVKVEKQQPGGVATYWVPLPFGSRFLRAFGSDGESADALSSHYSVTWFDAHAKPIRVITRAVDAPKVTAAEKAAAEASLGDFAKKMGVSGAATAATIPATKAPIVDIGFDLDGRLWVERSVPEGKPREADVYDRRGRLVSTMVWPAKVELKFLVARGGTALGVASDSLGVPSVVRLRFK